MSEAISNAALHRIQSALRRCDMMVESLIHGPINQPQSWTAQDIEVELHEVISDVSQYGERIHSRWSDFLRSHEHLDPETQMSEYCRREFER